MARPFYQDDGGLELESTAATTRSSASTGLKKVTEAGDREWSYPVKGGKGKNREAMGVDCSVCASNLRHAASCPVTAKAQKRSMGTGGYEEVGRKTPEPVQESIQELWKGAEEQRPYKVSVAGWIRILGKVSTRQASSRIYDPLLTPSVS